MLGCVAGSAITSASGVACEFVFVATGNGHLSPCWLLGRLLRPSRSGNLEWPVHRSHELSRADQQRPLPRLVFCHLDLGWIYSFHLLNLHMTGLIFYHQSFTLIFVCPPSGVSSSPRSTSHFGLVLSMSWGRCLLQLDCNGVCWWKRLCPSNLRAGAQSCLGILHSLS